MRHIALSLLTILSVAPITAESEVAESGRWIADQRLFHEFQQLHWSSGRAVAVDGDVVIVGAHNTPIDGMDLHGAAFVFRLRGDEWSEEQMLLPSSGEAQLTFGWSVAIEGDLAVVSAPSADYPGNINQGEVYVFSFDGASWVESQMLVGSDSDMSDRFGSSVDLEGDTLAVGADGAGSGFGVGAGAAYLFERQDEEWIETKKLSDPALGDSGAYGRQLDLDGSTLAVANLSDDTHGFNTGAVYVYVNSTGDWELEQFLTASDPMGAAGFGRAVALSGDSLIGGADQHDVDGASNQGVAYIFTRTDDVWTEQQQLLASNGAADDFFGKAVAIGDGFALVSGELNSSGPDISRGTVYEYRFVDGVWVEVSYFQADPGQGLDGFGTVLALDDTRLIVGNPGNISVFPPGGAWVYPLPPLFADGFESGDTSSWSITIGGR